MSRIQATALCAVVVMGFIALPVCVFAAGPRQVPEGALQKTADVYFNSANFQAGIHSSGRLSSLTNTYTSGIEDATAYRFAAKSDESKFFLVGTFYSEALAQVRIGRPEFAADRLRAIESQLIALQTPNSLFSFVSKTRNRIELGKYTNEAFYDILSFFQPFFEEYAESRGRDKLILFRAGSWLVDICLTTAADNRNLIKESRSQLTYFIREMKRMDAPKGVLSALERLDAIAGKNAIEDRDLEKILEQIKKIQMILG